MSVVEKRSVSIRGHRTSYTLERPFHDALAAIADIRQTTVAALVAAVDEGRPDGANLSSALRLHVLEHFQKEAANRSEEGRE